MANPNRPDTSKASKKDITIVGAGLVGSLLAILLAKNGHTVRVYERRPDMRQANIGAGKSINLALSDRGLKALDLIGLKAKVLELAIPMKGRMIHPVSGDLAFQPYGKEGQAINSVSRGGLNKLLMDEAEKNHGVQIYFDHRCLDVSPASGELLFDHEGNTIRVRSDLIFGADGAFSAVRGSMQITDRFDYSQVYLEHAYKELVIPPGTADKWQIEKNALHIWPRKSFMLIALPNLDGSFTCTLFLPFEGPVSFEKLPDESSLIRFFEAEFPDALPLMPTLTEDFFTNPTSSLVTIRAWPWSLEGKVALIGDAAHAIVPFYGQGMNAGFEDCTILQEVMEAHPDNWPLIFETYQRQRKPDAEAIADLAVKNFIEMRDKVADPVFLKRKRIEKKLQEKFPEAFIPQYSMVTFSHIPYATAMAEGRRQDELFDRIMQIEDIESNWDNPEILSGIEAWIRNS